MKRDPPAPSLVLALRLSLAAVACAGAPSAPPDPVDGGTASDAGTAPTWTIVLGGLPENTPAGAELYAAGSFNGWEAASPDHRFARGDDGLWRVSLGAARAGDRAEFKVTRGAWASVEKGHALEELPNRTITFDPAHPVAAAFVERWADLPAAQRTIHGSFEVRLFDLPQLGVERRVRVWLPPGHDVPGARFPVLYMYDGQNLFDRVTSAFGAEWRVDETVGGLVLEGRLAPVIVVAIDNSDARPCEYAPFASDPHPGCADGTTRGAATNAFLAETLKPWVDARYPTLPDRAHTAVAGASMGGQLALHAALTHPQVFSKAAVLSPSFQNVRTHPLEMPGFVRARGARGLRAWVDMGDAETIRDLDAALLLANMKSVAGALREAGADVREVVVPGGEHHERAWAARFADVVTWLWAPVPAK